MGLTHLDPVLATLRSPNSLFAVTSQAIKAHAKPRIGLSVAAIIFCLLHIRVKVIGRTADEMMTPINRYRYPIEIPMSVVSCWFSGLPVTTLLSIGTHKKDLLRKLPEEERTLQHTYVPRRSVAFRLLWG